MEDHTTSCIFCRIATGISPAQIEYQDEAAVVFWDIEPNAPIHLLVIPRQHIPALSEATEADTKILGQLLLIAKMVAQRKDIDSEGYRIVINCGNNAHQIVDHLHIHVLSGADLGPMTSAKPNLVSE